MSDMSDADFASYVDRIMACRDAEDAAKADTKLVYAAAADAGIDKTALGLFVRVERMDQTQVIKANRKDELTEEYRARYRRGKASHVRVREAGFEVTAPNTSVPAGFDAETGEEVTTPEINEPRNPAPQESAIDLTVPQALTGQVASQSTAARMDVPNVEADTFPADHTHPQVVRQEPGGRDAAIAGTQAPPVDTNVTTFRQPKPLRPNCLKPEMCGGQGRQHCWACTKAMNEVGAA